MSNEKQKPYKSTAKNKKNKKNIIPFGTWFNEKVSYSNIQTPPYNIDETLQTKFDEIPPEYKTKYFTPAEIDIINFSNTKPHEVKVNLLKKLNRFLLSLTIHKIRNPSEEDNKIPEDQYSFPTKPTEEERLKHLEYIKQIIEESNKQDKQNKNPIIVSSIINPRKTKKTSKTSTPPTGGSRIKTRKSRRQKTYRKKTQRKRHS